MTFTPTAAEGLLLFAGFSNSEFGDFISLALIGSRLQFSFNLGSGSASVSSEALLQLDTWYTVTLTLSGRNGSLRIDDQSQVFALSPPPFLSLNSQSNIWIGGFHTFMDLSSIVGTSLGFSGCVSAVSINGRGVELILDAEFGYGVTECASSSCSGNPCFNGGSCIETGASFVCVCTGPYTGALCGSTLDPCAEGALVCSTGATCQPSLDGLSFTCLCPTGRMGDLCDEGIYLQDNIIIPSCFTCIYICLLFSLQIPPYSFLSST